MYNPGPHEVLLYQVKQVEGKIAVQGNGEMDSGEYFASDRNASVKA